MLTIEQCRGARGLIGWTQQDLADASGLSKTAINNFEKRHSDIKAESLKAIRMAFESMDIEFLEQNGVRRKSENARLLKGKRGQKACLAVDLPVVRRCKAAIADAVAAMVGQPDVGRPAIG